VHRLGVIAVILIGMSFGFPRLSPGGQELSLDTLLARASEYALAYQQALSGVVSEERYVQTWRRGSRQPQVRTLRSDVLLTRPAGSSRSLFFRDVFEVDGRQVRDRDERLVQLFLTPSASSSTQVLNILQESARHNLGDMQRTVNTPTLALVFLDPQYRARFRFERTGDQVAETVRGAAAEGEVAQFTAPGDLAVVAYQEIARDSLIGTGAGLNLPASGRFWIEPATGRIIITELRLRDARIDALVDVRYDLSAAVDLLVPVAMRERYRDPGRNDVIEGTASYSRVRRFNVTSSEVVNEPVR
jgi:hypothetical protein